MAVFAARMMATMAARSTTLLSERFIPDIS
jgi:hypothetical protein